MFVVLERRTNGKREAVNVTMAERITKAPSGHAQVWFAGDSAMDAVIYDILFEDLVDLVEARDAHSH